MTTDKAAAPVGAVPQGDEFWLRAHQALEDMDDFARMAVGVAPHGPYVVLRDLLTKAKGWQADATKWLYAGICCNNEGILELKRRTEAAEAALASQAARMGELEQDAARLDWLNDADNAMDAGIYGIPTRWATGDSLRSRIDKLRGEAG